MNRLTRKFDGITSNHIKMLAHIFVQRISLAISCYSRICLESKLSADTLLSEKASNGLSFVGSYFDLPTALVIPTLYVYIVL